MPGSSDRFARGSSFVDYRHQQCSSYTRGCFERVVNINLWAHFVFDLICLDGKRGFGIGSLKSPESRIVSPVRPRKFLGSL